MKNTVKLILCVAVLIFALCFACACKNGEEPPKTDNPAGDNTTENPDGGEEVFIICNHTYGSDELCTLCGEHKYTEGLVFTLINNGTEYEISGLNVETAMEVYLPSSYQGKRVTSIGLGAFQDHRGIGHVFIANGVKNIGAHAFSGCCLASIDIPQSMEHIGIGAFFGCEYLKKVNIHDLKKWCEIEFATSSPIGIVGCCSDFIMYTVYEHGNQVRYSIENIMVATQPLVNGGELYLNGEIVEELLISKDIESVSALAFCGCSSIKKLIIEDGKTHLGELAFFGTTYLNTKEISIPDNILENNSLIDFGYSFMSFGACNFYEYENGLYLGNENNNYVMFYKNKTDAPAKLHEDTRIVLPGSIIEANERFKYVGDCLVDTETKTLIAAGASGVIPSDGSVTKIGTAAFQNAECQIITVPDCITELEAAAFIECDAKQVILPESITSIPKFAFASCEVKSISIPSSVKTIDDYAFLSCKTLENIEIPNGVKTIGNYAFAECRGVKSISIPSSVTSIGYFAFAGCSLEDGISVDSANTVYHSSENCLIETATKTLILGCTKSIIPNDGSVEIIGDGAFMGVSFMFEDVVIPEGVKRISSFAFCGAHFLGSILPFTVTEIGYNALWPNQNYNITVEFNGTVEEWNEIRDIDGLLKIRNLMPNTVKIICTDGEVSK